MWANLKIYLKTVEQSSYSQRPQSSKRLVIFYPLIFDSLFISHNSTTTKCTKLYKTIVVMRTLNWKLTLK